MFLRHDIILKIFVYIFRPSKLINHYMYVSKYFGSGELSDYVYQKYANFILSILCLFNQFRTIGLIMLKLIPRIKDELFLT